MKKAPGADVTKMDDAALARFSANQPGGLIGRLVSGWPKAGLTIEDRSIVGRDGSIPLRIYTPEREARQPRPLVLMIHGGGWALGGLDGADWIASTVAADLDAVVVSVGYRLAPAYRFPAAVTDCFDALGWCAANLAALGATAGRIGIMGESAGGNLTAVMCLLARDAGAPIVHHQTLIYPATDLRARTPSREINRDAIILNSAAIDRFVDVYAGSADPERDFRLSPLRAESHHGLPPCLIQVAGHDPLYDDGVNYAAKLRASGVPVVLTAYPAMPHGFVNLPYVSRDAKAALQQVVAEQRRFLRSELAPG